MTFQPEIAQDCLLVDGAETITLEGAATTTVPGAKRGTLAHREISQAGLGLEPTDAVWALPEVSLQGARPQAGNRITQSDGTKWTILSAVHYQLTGVWRTICRQQR